MGWIQIIPGDVLCVDRGKYKHFGVFSGYGNVIHYVKTIDAALVIAETPFQYFTGNDNWWICKFDSFGKQLGGNENSKPDSIVGGVLQIGELLLSEPVKLYSPEETVTRARSCLGQGGYNLVLHNCEHFAIWCKTGVERSEQIDRFIQGGVEIVTEPILRHGLEVVAGKAIEASEPFVESALKAVWKIFSK